MPVTAAHDLDPESVTDEHLRRTLVGTVDPYQPQQPARLIHEPLQQRGRPWSRAHRHWSPEQEAYVSTKAAQHDPDVAQLALPWVIGQDVVPIPGTKRRRDLEQNTAAATIEPTSEVIAAIDAVSPHGVAADERNNPRSTRLKRDRI
ncbi:aldo/keto reductase [Streptomyces sp. NBC_01451]|uniref:aldo/keto reductase n=1 Tax=Streptomyces sp. NBC_01451 TaxID=2903872 RepID=UPI002E2EDF4C|nr:aldo/keto reductase [Streptomyces sp. NBC_01451]